MSRKVLIQWAKRNSSGWEEIDLSRDALAWKKLPKKEQKRIFDLDQTPGLIEAVNIQGVVLEGFDNYAISPGLDGVIEAVAWREGEAQAWVFHPPGPDRTGLVNTKQMLTIYAGSALERHYRSLDLETTGGQVVILPIQAFTPPPAEVTRAGVRRGSLDRSHQWSRTQVGWREWV
jgi:hypothetical protein